MSNDLNEWGVSITLYHIFLRTFKRVLFMFFNPMFCKSFGVLAIIFLSWCHCLEHYSLWVFGAEGQVFLICFFHKNIFQTSVQNMFLQIFKYDIDFLLCGWYTEIRFNIYQETSEVHFTCFRKFKNSVILWIQPPALLHLFSTLHFFSCISVRNHVSCSPGAPEGEFPRVP